MRLSVYGIALLISGLILALLPLLASAQLNVSSDVCPCPDVFLNVSNVSVDSIVLNVTDVAAQLNLDAKVFPSIKIFKPVRLSCFCPAGR
jgi:hypothetical protein